MRKRGKERAADALTFIENLRHFIGQWAGERFALLPWQRKLVADLFGTLDGEGNRQYRTAYVEVPRKNGKSHLAAAIALYLLVGDNEPGAEVYGAGFDRDQAAIVFRIAKQMVQASEDLSDILICHDSIKKIEDRETGSFYQAVSRDTLGAFGYNPHGIIFDEIHTQRTRELWDTLTMGMGSRRQPLVFGITTAGVGTQSLCRELHNYSQQILTGAFDDPSWFAYIKGAPDDADWTDRKVWKAANPSYGVTVFEKFLREECDRALRMPTYQNEFRRFYLNQWVQQETRWMPLQEWDACAGAIDIEDLRGQPCFAGLDMASTQDLNAFVLIFPPEPYRVLCHFWIPGDNIRERSRRDLVPYETWAREGIIEKTPGNVTDYDWVADRISQIGKEFRIKEIAFDRWGAQAVVNKLQERNFEMVQFGQGFASMSAPTKELMRLILGRRIAHGGNPILRWNADNVVASEDPAGNIKPDKQKSQEKIDGVVALVMALDRATRQGEDRSVYEGRGVLVL